MFDLGNGNIALRSDANGRYVTADNSGASPLIASHTAVGTWETFQAVDQGAGYIALFAMGNGRYVTADNSGASPLIANRTAVGNWEKFLVVGTAPRSTLRGAAQENAMFVGSIAWPARTSDTRYLGTLDREFNYFHSAEMGWSYTEPNQGNYNFSGADSDVAHADAHGQRIKGGALVWHGDAPAWVNSVSDLRTAMVNHINAEVGHLRNRVPDWEVVNEPFNDNGTLRGTVFLNKIGAGYIDLAFQTAHAADPSALLFLNDYGIEGINTKSTAVYNYICGPTGMRARGIPIHGVAFEGRVPTGYFGDLFNNVARFRNCGLAVDLSEIKSTSSDQNLQRSTYWDLIRICIYTGCRAVTFAGLDVLFDSNYNAMIGYSGARDSLQGIYWRTLNTNPYDHSITFIGFAGTPYRAEYNVGTGWFQLATPYNATSAMKPIYLCRAGAVDHFLSAASNCEGQQVLGMYGYGFKNAGPGLIPIKRCLYGSDHFHSRDAACEAQVLEGTLFYSP